LYSGQAQACYTRAGPFPQSSRYSGGFQAAGQVIGYTQCQKWYLPEVFFPKRIGWSARFTVS